MPKAPRDRRENITDWALDQFRSHYADPSITKWDIFHYVYAILHHPDYRERYAANLRRELPRIPFVGGNEPSQSADNSPGGAADVSPGRKPGVDRKIENNSALPKAVAGGHSPQATSPHQCWRTAEAPLNFPKIIATKSPAR